MDSCGSLLIFTVALLFSSVTAQSKATCTSDGCDNAPKIVCDTAGVRYLNLCWFHYVQCSFAVTGRSVKLGRCGDGVSDVPVGRLNLSPTPNLSNNVTFIRSFGDAQPCAPSSIKTALSQRLALRFEALRAGIPQLAAEIFHPNGFILSTDAATAVGRPSIVNHFQLNLALSGGQLLVDRSANEVFCLSPDWAMDRGAFNLRDNRGNLLRQQRGVLVWQRVSDTWYIHSETDITDCTDVSR